MAWKPDPEWRYRLGTLVVVAAGGFGLFQLYQHVSWWSAAGAWVLLAGVYYGLRRIGAVDLPGREARLVARIEQIREGPDWRRT